MTHKRFSEVFGCEPRAQADAPGRVNLLGEHTDYNDGFVLPTAIAQRTCVQLAPSMDADDHLFAARLNQRVRYTRHAPLPAGFARYVLGCMALLRERGYPVGPLLVHVDSDVPIGAGLSSSAALEVAVLRALRIWRALPLDDVALAQIAQQAEIQYAQVNCGIMDQMASSLADAEHMLFLDTRSLAYRLLPLPADADLLVIDSGIPRSLANSAYNLRREECEQAAQLLGVKALRDVDTLGALAGLPDVLQRRARHVLTENARVLAAADGVTATEFGKLMNASHASLRDDFAVSIPELDELVALLQQHPQVLGARLTGAGFGGACVALVQRGSAAHVAAEVLAAYSGPGRVLV